MENIFVLPKNDFHDATVMAKLRSNLDVHRMPEITLSNPHAVQKQLYGVHGTFHCLQYCVTYFLLTLNQFTNI